MSTSLSARTLAMSGVVSALELLLDQPAQAHGFAQPNGIAHGGIAAGFLHPISGVDHLLVLVGIGAAASCISAQLLLWALAGAIGGGVLGAMGGTLPAQEFLAALAIKAVAVLVLRSLRSQQSPQLGVCAVLVAAAVAVHAMLHGLEAPADGSALLWWLGAFSGSVLVSGGSFLALWRLPLAWTRAGSVREPRGRRLPGGIRRVVPRRHGAAGAVGLGARRRKHGCALGLKADPAGAARVLRRWEPSCRAEALEPARTP